MKRFSLLLLLSMFGFCTAQNTGRTIEGSTLLEISQHYQISSGNLVDLVSKELLVGVNVKDSFKNLHDIYGLKIEDLKNIIGKINGDFSEEQEEVYDSGFEIEMEFYIFFLIIIFFAAALFASKKITIDLKKIFDLLCYKFLPLFLLGIVIFYSFFGSGGLVFENGKVLGYRTLWLLYIILLVKPLTLLLIGKEHIALKKIREFSCFVMRRRREFGVLVFYFGLMHLLIYLFFWFTQTSSFFGFFDVAIFFVGLASFLALLVGYLSSNDYSVSYLGKNWKKVQMSAYLALLFAAIHIIIVNISTIFVLLPMILLYGSLKYFEFKKLNIGKDMLQSPSIAPVTNTTAINTNISKDGSQSVSKTKSEIANNIKIKTKKQSTQDGTQNKVRKYSRKAKPVDKDLSAV